MRLRLLILAAVAAALASCAAEPAPKNTAAAVPPPASKANDVPVAQPVEAARISLADAKREYDAGTAVMVDVRTAEVFAVERIKGAVHLPYDAIGSAADNIPKGKKLIVYCS